MLFVEPEGQTGTGGEHEVDKVHFALTAEQNPTFLHKQLSPVFDSCSPSEPARLCITPQGSCLRTYIKNIKQLFQSFHLSVEINIPIADVVMLMPTVRSLQSNNRPLILNELKQ